MTATPRPRQQPDAQYDFDESPPNPLLQWWDQWQGRVIPLALIILTFVVFASALGNGWLNGWDDEFYVTDNPLVTKFSVGNLIDIWTTFRRGEYLPVTLTTLAVEHLIFGDSAGGYHLVNVLLHALSGVLVYTCLTQIQHRQSVAIIAAVVFLVHPLQVESVAWIAQLKTILSGFLFLGALWLHLYASRKKGRTGALTLSYVVFALSLLAKPAAILAPLLFLAFDYGWTRLSFSAILMRNLPYLLISGGVSVLVMLAQNDNGGLAVTGTDGILQHAQLTLWAIWDYVAALFAPINLNNLYIYDLDKLGFGNLRMWLGLLVIIFSLVLALWQPLGKRITLFALMGFWLFFLPLSNIISIGYPRADRFMYLPMILFGLLIGLLFAKLWDILPRPELRYGVTIVTTLVIVLFAILSISRNGVWENMETLMTNHINDYPSSTTGLNKLSAYYLETGNLNRAIEVTADLVRTNPNDPDKIDQLALVAMAQGNYEAAVELYVRSLQLRPDDPARQFRLGGALVNWGLQFFNEGRYEDALSIYVRALDYIPNEPSLHNNIGFTLYTQGRFDQALIAYNEALTLDPNYTKAWMNLGDAALNLGNYELAGNAYTRAAQLGGEFSARSASNYCLALGELRQDSQVALTFCQRAIELEPTNGLYLGRTAHVLLIFGDYESARAVAQQAVQLAPDLPLNQRVLGDAYRLTGNVDGARAAYQAALVLNPDSVEAQQGLALLNQPAPTGADTTGTDTTGTNTTGGQ